MSFICHCCYKQLYFYAFLLPRPLYDTVDRRCIFSGVAFKPPMIQIKVITACLLILTFENVGYSYFYIIAFLESILKAKLFCN